MLDNAEKLVASVCRSLGIVQAGSPPSCLCVQTDLQNPAKHSLFMNRYNVQSVATGSHCSIEGFSSFKDSADGKF